MRKAPLHNPELRGGVEQPECGIRVVGHSTNVTVTLQTDERAGRRTDDWERLARRPLSEFMRGRVRFVQAPCWRCRTHLVRLVTTKHDGYSGGAFHVKRHLPEIARLLPERTRTSPRDLTLS
jgi:hypothetical protein